MVAVPLCPHAGEVDHLLQAQLGAALQLFRRIDLEGGEHLSLVVASGVLAAHGDPGAQAGAQALSAGIVAKGGLHPLPVGAVQALLLLQRLRHQQMVAEHVGNAQAHALGVEAFEDFLGVISFAQNDLDDEDLVDAPPEGFVVEVVLGHEVLEEAEVLHHPVAVPAVRGQTLGGLLGAFPVKQGQEHLPIFLGQGELLTVRAGQEGAFHVVGTGAVEVQAPFPSVAGKGREHEEGGGQALLPVYDLQDARGARGGIASCFVLLLLGLGSVGGICADEHAGEVRPLFPGGLHDVSPKLQALALAPGVGALVVGKGEANGRFAQNAQQGVLTRFHGCLQGVVGARSRCGPLYRR